MPFDYDNYNIKCASLSALGLQKEWEKYTRQMSGGSTNAGLSLLAVPFTLGTSLVGVGFGSAQVRNAHKKRRIIEAHMNLRYQESARTRCRDVVFGSTLSGAVFVATLGTVSVLPGADCAVEAVVQKVVVHGVLDVAAEKVDEECTGK